MSKIEELAGKLSLALKENLSSHNASGRLIQSITSSVAYKDGQIEVTIDAEEYAKYLNDGTKPHFPPVDKILEWVRVKPIMPRPGKDGKLPTEEQLAYLIGRKISKSGTKGTHFIDKTLEQENFIERLEKAIVDELEKQFDDEHIQEIFKDVV